MARRVAAFSLVELTLTIALLAILAIPMGSVVVEHVKGSIQADDSIATTNLARYEQELLSRPLGVRPVTGNWCSVPRAALPAPDPDRASCPAAVSPPNPYAGMPFVVYRINSPQIPTDGSTGLRRITVKVKRILRASGSSITALEPLTTVTTYQASGVTFGT